jgi:hypothetical protein
MPDHTTNPDDVDQLDTVISDLVNTHGLAAVIEALEVHAGDQARAYQATYPPSMSDAYARMKAWEQMAVILGEVKRSASQRRL